MTDQPIRDRLQTYEKPTIPVRKEEREEEMRRLREAREQLYRPRREPRVLESNDDNSY